MTLLIDYMIICRNDLLGWRCEHCWKYIYSSTTTGYDAVLYYYCIYINLFVMKVE